MGVANWDSPGRDFGSLLDGECASAIPVVVIVEEAGNREMICYWNFPKTANFLARYRWRWRARGDLLWKGQMRATGVFGGDGISFHCQARESADGGGAHSR